MQLISTIYFREYTTAKQLTVIIYKSIEDCEKNFPRYLIVWIISVSILNKSGILLFRKKKNSI